VKHYYELFHNVREVTHKGEVVQARVSTSFISENNELLQNFMLGYEGVGGQN
jgi:hypothetical protein